MMFILKDKINNKYLKFDSEKATVFFKGKFNPTKVLVDSKEEATIFDLNVKLPEVFYNLFEDMSGWLLAQSYVGEDVERHKFRAWFRYLSAIEIDKAFYNQTRNGIPYNKTRDYEVTKEFTTSFLSELEVQVVEYYPYDLKEMTSVILKTAFSLSDDSRFEWAVENVAHALEDTIDKSCANISRTQNEDFVRKVTPKLPNQGEVRSDGWTYTRDEFDTFGLYGSDSYGWLPPSPCKKTPFKKS